MVGRAAAKMVSQSGTKVVGSHNNRSCGNNKKVAGKRDTAKVGVERKVSGKDSRKVKGKSDSSELRVVDKKKKVDVLDGEDLAKDSNTAESESNSASIVDNGFIGSEGKSVRCYAFFCVHDECRIALTIRALIKNPSDYFQNARKQGISTYEAIRSSCFHLGRKNNEKFMSVVSVRASLLHGRQCQALKNSKLKRLLKAPR